MSNLDRLLAKGAQIVGGDLILRHQVVGMFRYGDLIITPEGEAELEIVDVEVKETKKPRAKKVEETATPADDVTIEV